MTTTPRGSPELGVSQAQKEQTHNEAIRRTEAGACHFPVADRITTPPGTCSDGANYIITATATGLWTGKENQIATAVGTNAANGWYYHSLGALGEGATAYVQDENARYLYDGSAWGVEASTYTDEQARDAIGAALVAGTNVTITVNDAGDTITIDATGGGSYTGGKQTVPVLASAMTPRTTNGPAEGTTESATNKVMTRTLDFDQTTAEYAQIMFPMPKSWDEGPITAQFIWTAGVTGDVVWACRAVAISDDDVLDAAFGTAQSVTDGVTAAGDVMISAETSAITIAGSPAEGDLVVLEFYRDAANGSDNAAGDAKLIAVKVFLTTNAATDA